MEPEFNSIPNPNHYRHLDYNNWLLHIDTSLISDGCIIILIRWQRVPLPISDRSVPIAEPLPQFLRLIKLIVVVLDARNDCAMALREGLH